MLASSSKNRIQDFILSCGVSLGTSDRFPCPACGCKDFSVSNVNGKLIFNCFDARCKLRGAIRKTRTAGELRASLSVDKSGADVTPTLHRPRFEIPSYVVSPLSNPSVLRYMERHHCMEAYTRRFADIRYDPRQDRVMFVIYDAKTGLPVDAVGRSLSKTKTSKWFRYADSGSLFITPLVMSDSVHSRGGLYDIAVCVEDPASACAVAAAGYTGVSLMGTSLSEAFLGPLANYKRRIIALDKDARRTALKMRNAMKWIGDTSIALLEDDLKYSDAARVREIINKEQVSCV